MSRRPPTPRESTPDVARSTTNRIAVRRVTAVVAVVACAGLVVHFVSSPSRGGGRGPQAAAAVQRSATAGSPPGSTTSTSTQSTQTTAVRARPKRSAPSTYRVGVLNVHLVDPHRTMPSGSGQARRAFDVIVRYPLRSGAANGEASFPLIVFGHGFAVTPAPYSALLGAWARAGYVVAAPIFPLENGNHPGGPDERDLVNQPRDMSLVISSLTADSARASGRLAGLINPTEIAVAGQSDGGDTALGAAYDPAVRDPRIGAAIILSGAEDPFAHPFHMPADGPPLLAIQGTADTINPPPDTYQFFAQAAPPKFLLKLLGAGHLPPYTAPGPELTAVERTTLAFLGWRFKHSPRALGALMSARAAGPSTALTWVR